MSIKDSILKYNEELSPTAELVAVSKTKPVEAILEAYEAGQRDFGENKIQEMVGKYEELPKDIRWHMIGHIQTNKVKYMASFVHLVHGVDREKVLTELNKQAGKVNRQMNCLLQIHIAQEDTKFGFSYDECEAILGRLEQFPNVQVVGLMGMASNTDDSQKVKQEFGTLGAFYNKHKEEQGWHTLSMGMSGDYPLALEAGSTHVRIGSAIFGARNYQG
jgi:hypothetical protein